MISFRDNGFFRYASVTLCDVELKIQYPLSPTEYSHHREILKYCFPISGKWPEILSWWLAQVCQSHLLASHARPEWSGDPSITDSDSSQAPLSSGSDPDSGSSWVSIIWPPRPATSRPLWAAPESTRRPSVSARDHGHWVKSAANTTPLLTCWQPAAHTLKINSPRLRGLGKYYVSLYYLSVFSAQGGYGLASFVSLALRHIWHLHMCT